MILVWKQVDDYYHKCITTDCIFYISKSNIYEKVIYELWKGNNWLYKSKELSDCKKEAERVYDEHKAL